MTRGKHTDLLTRFRPIMFLPFHGSSVKAVDKRKGADAHNWGMMKDDIETCDFLVMCFFLLQFKRLSRVHFTH